MQKNTQYKGQLTEQKCFVKCLEAGYLISKPLFDNARYDFILDTGNQLLKIQVKTSRDEGDKFSFETASSHITRQGATRRSYENEIDFFCTWFNK